MSKIDVLPTLSIKGIYYIGQYGTSGYATAAKGYLYHYFSMGIPILWDPLYFDDSILTDDDAYNITVKSLINLPLDQYDIVMLHSTPDLWPMFRTEKRDIINGKIIIGIFVWETDTLPSPWVPYINNSVHEVWVPSNYNADVLKNSGVTIPIRVVPYIFLHQPLPDRSKIKLYDSINNSLISGNEYTFYSIGELNHRKGITDLIKVFCETFTNKDNVRLILKVHYRNYTPEYKLYCEDTVRAQIESYPTPPKIICLLDNMSNKEILAIHSLGDCYVSLTKSEGFGLTIFDAFNYKIPIITTGYSGHIDFLGQDYPGLVKYKLDFVKGMESFSEYYTKNQKWAIPDLQHVKELMIRAINHKTI
jgi:glycosyltransferase involved in cell wall biosynthesis